MSKSPKKLQPNTQNCGLANCPLAAASLGMVSQPLQFLGLVGHMNDVCKYSLPEGQTWNGHGVSPFSLQRDLISQAHGVSVLNQISPGEGVSAYSWMLPQTAS